MELIYGWNEKKEKVLEEIRLSDGTKRGDKNYNEKLSKAFKETTGSYDPKAGLKILINLALGIGSLDVETRINHIAKLLSALKPKNEIEAMLFGQFLVLQDSAMTCIKVANSTEIFHHRDRHMSLAVKLSRCANETIQTLLKHKNEGKQQVVVAHVSGGQAVIANEIINNGGVEKK